MTLKTSSYRRNRKPPATALLSLLLIFLVVASSSFTSACKETSVAPANTENSVNANTGDSVTAPAEQKAESVQDKGDFKIVYSKIKNRKYARWQKDFQEEKVFEGMVADLNQTFILPTDVFITFTECDEANAFYDSEKRTLSICYELLENYYEIFAKHEKSKEALDDAVIGATVHTFYHELGHAFIDIFDLPITGKEEDAVDQLSTFILTDGTDAGEKAALDGARAFYLEGKQQNTGIDDLPYWDEHSLDLQRFYNIICLVYGQNEEKYDYLVEKGTLPEDRAEGCAYEYQQVEKAWTTLLAPHIKK